MSAENNIINVAFAVDRGYVKYLSVAIKSLLNSSNVGVYFNIYIFVMDVDNESQFLLLEEFKNEARVSISVIDVKDQINKIPIFSYVRVHFTEAMYIRFLIPIILYQVKRIIYLDTDICVLGDLINMYNVDLNGNTIAGIPDQLINGKKNEDFKNYLDQALNLRDAHKYINSGVLVIDCDRWRAREATEACISVLMDLEKPLHPDQDVINIVFGNDILYLDDMWNYQWHQNIREGKNCIVDNKFYLLYSSINIIHYTSGIKPWSHPELLLAEKWWKVARSSVFYEQFMQQCFFTGTESQLNNNKSENPKLIIPRDDVFITSNYISLIKIKKKINFKSVYFVGVRIYNRSLKNGVETRRFLGIPYYKKIKSCGSNIN